MTDSIRTHTDQAGFLNLTPEPWVAEASCASSGHPDAWFPEKGGSVHDVKSICAACPVIQECEDYAIRHRIFEGVWGGKSPRARQADRERAAQARREAS